MPTANQQIPTGWKVAKLGEVSLINPKINFDGINDEKLVGFISMGDVSNSAKIENIQERPFKKVSKGFTKFQTGDVLFAKITPCMENGKGGLLKDAKYPLYFGSTEFHVVRATQSIDNFFIHQLLNNEYFRKIAAGHMRGSAGQRRVPKEFLESYELVLPPLSEQIKIAAILSKVDEEIEKVERIIEQTEKLKKGLIQRLLTKGIGHTKFKKTELGEIPEVWEVVRLEEICKLITDGKHGDCRNGENSGYYFISVKDIFDGKIHYDDARQITKEDFLEVNKRTQFEFGDLLITNSGTIGRIAIAPDDEKTRKTIFQKSVAIIKPMHNLVSVIFLSYVLQILKDRLVIDASGSAQKNLLLKDLRAAKIFLPHIVEQNTIASVLSKISNKISINQKIRTNFLKLKKGLMNDLLSGKVRIIN